MLNFYGDIGYFKSLYGYNGNFPLNLSWFEQLTSCIDCHCCPSDCLVNDEDNQERNHRCMNVDVWMKVNYW